MRALKLEALKALRGSGVPGPSVGLVALLAGAPAAAQAPRTVEPNGFALAFERGAQLPKLRSLLISVDGRIVGERYYHGATRARP